MISQTVLHAENMTLQMEMVHLWARIHVACYLLRHVTTLQSIFRGDSYCLQMKSRNIDPDHVLNDDYYKGFQLQLRHYVPFTYIQYSQRVEEAEVLRNEDQLNSAQTDFVQGWRSGRDKELRWKARTELSRLVQKYKSSLRAHFVHEHLRPTYLQASANISSCQHFALTTWLTSTLFISTRRRHVWPILPSAVLGR